MKILLVDNTAVYRNILQQSLADFVDCELLFAENCAQALALGRQHTICFFIVAWQLPDGEGLDLVREMRDSDVAPKEPIVLLTSSPSEQLAEQAAQAGVTELFRKHDFDELLIFMHRFLALYRPLYSRILYVEDSRDQRLALVAELESWGVQVDAFASADEAWRAFQDTRYDLLLCDVVLEGRMSGSHLINRIRRQPGSKGNIPILAVSAFDNQARRIELFYLGIDDYIAKPVASMELRARIQNLLERKQALDRNTLLLQATSLGVLLTDSLGMVVSADANAQAIFHAAESALSGQRIFDLLPLPVSAGLGRPSGDFSRQALVREKVEAIRLDACRFPAEVSLLPLFSGFGGQQFAFLVRDLTAENELQRQLLEAKESAERFSRQKSEFLANMSHEIRTPLNGVLGMAQIGLRSSADQHKTENALRKIINSGRLLQGIIDDILDFSKIEAGKLKIEVQSFDLNEVLVQTLDLVREPAQSKNLDLTLTCAPDLPLACWGDSLRLRQILMNLLSNAVKFTQQGQVSLHVAQVGQAVQFTVEDSGIGMDGDALARLFQPFEQGDGSITRRFGGTGLGLAITHRLVEMMHGQISVQSQPGKGSVFKILLPLIEPHGLQPSDGDGQQVAHGQRLAGLSILLAEDNETNQMILREILEHEGARVDIVSDGQQALDRLALRGGDAFSLVLMDIMMPVLDGKAATRQVVARYPGLPVIGQTAHAYAEERDACREAGMLGHVTKPIDPETLFTEILRHARRA